MKIAIVGAYGNGKTTLGTELAQGTGLRLVHGAPMRDPAGSTDRSLEECTEPELIQLTVRRFAERAVGEAMRPDGFISDGSVLHEWVYAKVRLALGTRPKPPQTLSLSKAPRSARTEAYEEVVDQIGLLACQHAALGYDCFIRLPAELPLHPGHQPISEHFRAVSDQVLAAALTRISKPVSLVTGSLDDRVRASLELIRQFPKTAA